MRRARSAAPALKPMSPRVRAAIEAQHPSLLHEAGRSKYGNKPTELDGVTYHSAKEARRIAQLRQWERVGLIRELETQPEFPLVVMDKRTGQPVSVGSYFADAAWTVVDPRIAPPGFAPGDRVVEDVKSEVTAGNALYRLKKKLVAALHGVDVVEV